MTFLEKIQNQPENVKKIILWLIVAIIILFILVFWWRGFKVKIENFNKEEIMKRFELPQIPQQSALPNLEKINNINNLKEEDLEKIDEIIKSRQTPQNTPQ